MSGPTQAVSREALAQIFAVFAEHECRDYSPLYHRLCLGIAEDAELLDLAAAAKSWPVPNVFLAAVHFLLLEDPGHPLAAYYPSVSGASPPEDDPFPPFRAFCQEQDDLIRRLIAIRLTQTNEVTRCACLLPALGVVAGESSGRPLAIVEAGCSAGLNLLWDRYGYNYGNGRTYGDAESPVQLQCKWRSEGGPRGVDPLPKVAYRLGIDLNPVDTSDPDEALWLRALIWPEHETRAAVLAAAVELARDRPPPLLRGDALDLLPDVLEAAPQNAALCVVHAFTILQFSRDSRHYFSEILRDESHHRPVYRISFEAEQPRSATVRLKEYRDGERVTDRELAFCHPHGQWLEWRA